MKAYYFEGRNTPVLADSASAARAKCKRGCGKLVKSRALSSKEQKQASKGEWVTTRANGKPRPSKGVVKSGASTGYGPSKQAIAKAKANRR